MKRKLIITGLAETDVLKNHQWWSKHRSPEQANRWLDGIYATMSELSVAADRYPLASETLLRKAQIRQASFGLSGKNHASNSLRDRWRKSNHLSCPSFQTAGY